FMPRGLLRAAPGPAAVRYKRRRTLYGRGMPVRTRIIRIRARRANGDRTRTAIASRLSVDQRCGSADGAPRDAVRRARTERLGRHPGTGRTFGDDGAASRQRAQREVPAALRTDRRAERADASDAARTVGLAARAVVRAAIP